MRDPMRLATQGGMAPWSPLT